MWKPANLPYTTRGLLAKFVALLEKLKVKHQNKVCSLHNDTEHITVCVNKPPCLSFSSMCDEYSQTKSSTVGRGTSEQQTEKRLYSASKLPSDFPKNRQKVTICALRIFLDRQSVPSVNGQRGVFSPLTGGLLPDAL